MRRALIVLVGLLVVAATACGDPNALTSGNRELAGYLSSMYRIQGDQMTALAALTPGSEILDASDEDDLVALLQETAQQIDAIFQQYIVDLEAIDPPPGAAALHADLIVSMEHAAGETKRILEDMASDDVDVVIQAQQDQAALLQETLSDSGGLGEELAAMVLEVLADRDDPESVYIRELLALRTSGALERVSDLLGELETAEPDTPEEVSALIDRSIGVLETIRADYAAITPPERWAAIHAEQIALIDDGIALYARFGNLLTRLDENPEAVEPEELRQLFRDLIDWVARGPALSAALAYELAGYFEELS